MRIHNLGEELNFDVLSFDETSNEWTGIPLSSTFKYKYGLY